MADEQRSIGSLYSLKKISIYYSAKNVVDIGTLKLYMEGRIAKLSGNRVFVSLSLWLIFVLIIN